MIIMTNSKMYTSLDIKRCEIKFSHFHTPLTYFIRLCAILLSTANCILQFVNNSISVGEIYSLVLIHYFQHV